MKKKREKVATSSSSSSSSSSSESEHEEEIKPQRSKAIPIADQRAKTKARVKKVSHEALTNEVVRQELKERIMKQNYMNAFASIFPGKINPYS